MSYKQTVLGLIEENRWYAEVEKRLDVDNEVLLQQIQVYVKQHCFWLKSEEDIRRYSIDCFMSEAYKHWKNFAKC